VTRSADTNADDARCPIQRTPLALNAHKSGPEVEKQVVSPVLADWLQDLYPELDCLEGDCGLGDVAFVVGGEHLAILAALT
jgi:hypothetical protein